jgi:hypothetical protein
MTNSDVKPIKWPDGASTSEPVVKLPLATYNPFRTKHSNYKKVLQKAAQRKRIKIRAKISKKSRSRNRQ